MKYDPNQKQPRGIERTLTAFAEAMFDLLGQKPFEKISVNELCDRADYPRATFYNYFDDKYDLVSYCWFLVTKEVHLAPQTRLKDSSLLDVFEAAYRMFDQHRALLLAILSNNPIDSQLISSFLNHLGALVEKLLYERLRWKPTKTPTELVAKHYGNTVLLVLEWVFLGQHDTTLEEAESWLTELLAPPTKLTQKSLQN